MTGATGGLLYGESRSIRDASEVKIFRWRASSVAATMAPCSVLACQQQWLFWAKGGGGAGRVPVKRRSLHGGPINETKIFTTPRRVDDNARDRDTTLVFGD